MSYSTKKLKGYLLRTPTLTCLIPHRDILYRMMFKKCGQFELQIITITINEQYDGFDV